MREILFRGKRKTGKWIEGSLVVSNGPANTGRCYILPKFSDIRHGYGHELGDKIGGFYEVVPETIGQFTGLTDKNGKRIFEADIIRTKEYGKCLGWVNVRGFDIFSVVYSPAVFRIERESPPRVFNFVGNGADYEIIGNIHDNPELLVEVSDNG